MNRGIYILANDRVIDNAIALLNSIRLHDPNTAVVMIPYDKHYKKAAKVLSSLHGVKVYEDLRPIERLIKALNKIFGRRFFTRPDILRKQACWFGPFDEFLYIDTDIVVFERIVDNLNHFSGYDFICCDHQYSNGIRYVFTPKILDGRIFSKEDLKDVFNGGFWCSKKGLISENDLYDTFRECKSRLEYLDFSEGVSDMPIINYLVLKRIAGRINIAKVPAKGPGSWAGNPSFKRRENKLIDPNVNMALKYLHWAGIKIEPGCPYWDIWKYYRSL